MVWVPGAGSILWEKISNSLSFVDDRFIQLFFDELFWMICSPSGTAITLAEQIIQNNSSKNNWVNLSSTKESELEIFSQRIDPAPGTHTIKYSSSIDDIEITHTAHNRVGFASGAVLAAEFIANKKGIFTMKDVLGL